jgi:hypothetical protein
MLWAPLTRGLAQLTETNLNQSIAIECKDEDNDEDDEVYYPNPADDDAGL